MALNILVVDDEVDILDLIRNCLAADEHNITTASSFLQATQLLEQADYDLFILDLGLGDGSGLDLVQKIRAKHHSWIIILSGRTDPIDRVVGLEIGADDYINKPFHVRELRSRVNAAERRMNTDKTDIMDASTTSEGFSGLNISFAKRRIERLDGSIIPLSAQEFAVLQYLLEHPETAHSRDDIMAAALGGQQDRGERIVDTLIRRIRGKLFPDGTGAQWIKTIHGKGYQIAHPQQD